MSQESQLEEALCFAALNVPDPVLRARFLDRACAGDARLRAAVMERLSAYTEAEEFFVPGHEAVNAPGMGSPAPASPAAACDTDFIGAQISCRDGCYRLAQKIGEGGGGTVYLAEQEEPVRRQVAIKVIKLGLDTRQVIARFEAERQALALMDHPNIAHVLDAGATATGRPFFVMELVRGTRITKYCDGNHLTINQRLALFIQICQAIQHAHQKGIIHRDIKPANILVMMQDGKPVPKVIDFGIAKATEGRLAEHTLLTVGEQVVGTPAYMSPEQAAVNGLDIDTRSDIYSLGVLLYELLTSRTPFNTQTLMQSGLAGMRQILREQEPQRPSAMITSLGGMELALIARERHTEPPQLIAQIKGDLDWIVMRALEKDRNHRYETANGLAMDIRRYLSSEPVVARPPSQLYWLHKLVLRNRLAFTAAGAVVLVLLLSSGLSTGLFFRERAARKQAVQLRAVAEDRTKITQAAMLAGQGKYEAANQILAQINPLPAQSTLEDMSVYRAVGEWLALQGRWPAAAERYAALLQMEKMAGSRPDNAISNFGDYQAYGVVLAEAGDREKYRRFWPLAVANFTAIPNGNLLLVCLLEPLSPPQLAMLTPLVNHREQHFHDLPASRISDGDRLAMSLWKYRQGDYAAAADWCQKGLAQKNLPPVCGAALHLILAMTDHQGGQFKAAQSEWAQGRQIIETRFKSDLSRGKAGTGFWFDWVFDRHLLQEATVLITGQPVPPTAR